MINLNATIDENGCLLLHPKDQNMHVSWYVEHEQQYEYSFALIARGNLIKRFYTAEQAVTFAMENFDE